MKKLVYFLLPLLILVTSCGSSDSSDSNSNTGNTVTSVDVLGISAIPSSISTVVNTYSSEFIKVRFDPPSATNKNVKYTSDNDSIATVNGNGLVYGVNVGSTTITVQSLDNDSVALVVNVTVSNVAIPITDLQITLPSPQLVVGQSLSSNVSYVPDNTTQQNISYSSSDPSVAMVDENGDIHLLSVGSATITVTSVANPNVSSVIQVTVISQLDAKCSDEDGIGYDNINGKWEIYNVNGLASFRDAVNNDGETDLSAKLLCDIALDNTSVWIPIGNTSNKYMGKFNGDNKTITGLFIDSPTLDYQGLFGSIGAGGIISNLVVQDAYVVVNTSSGIIAGENSGTIAASYIDNSTIKGNDKIGGIAGYNSSAGVIAGVYSGDTNIVATAPNARVGGINGFNDGTVVVTFIDNVTITPYDNTTYYLGGIVGYNSGSVISSFSAGLNLGEIPTYSGNIVGFNEGTGEIISTYYIPTSVQNGIGSGIGEASPVANNFELNGEVGKLNNALLSYDSTIQYYFAINDDDSSIPLIKSGVPEFSDYIIHNGVWRIYTLNGLIEFQAETLDNKSVSAVLMDNISFKGRNNWEPIGINNALNTESYTGVFDGDNYTISGINIDNSSQDYVGLFGLVGVGGFVKNLQLSNINISGNNYVGAIGRNDGFVSNVVVNSGSFSGLEYIGGIAGWSDGVISSSANSASIAGQNNIGGLVGWNTSLISQSANAGAVVGGDNAGGIVGGNTANALITETYNVGDVSGSNNIGGLVGENSSTSRVNVSFNAGKVRGSLHVGGIVGSNNGSLVAIYNTGNVSGTSNIGGIIGTNVSGSILTSSYNVGNISGTLVSGAIVGWNAGTVNDTLYLKTSSINSSQSSIGLNVGGSYSSTNSADSIAALQSGSNVNGLNNAITTYEANNNETINFEFSVGSSGEDPLILTTK